MSRGPEVYAVARALSEAGCAADWRNALEGAEAAIAALSSTDDHIADVGKMISSTDADQNQEAQPMTSIEHRDVSGTLVASTEPSPQKSDHDLLQDAIDLGKITDRQKDTLGSLTRMAHYTRGQIGLHGEGADHVLRALSDAFERVFANLKVRL